MINPNDPISAKSDLRNQFANLTLSGLLVLAAIAIGVMLNLPSSGTILLVIGVVAVHRILWAIFPNFMHTVETNPAATAERREILNELEDRIRLRELLASPTLSKEDRQKLEQEFDKRLKQG